MPNDLPASLRHHMSLMTPMALRWLFKAKDPVNFMPTDMSRRSVRLRSPSTSLLVLLHECYHCPATNPMSVMSNKSHVGAYRQPPPLMTRPMSVVPDVRSVCACRYLIPTTLDLLRVEKGHKEESSVRDCQSCYLIFASSDFGSHRVV